MKTKLIIIALGALFTFGLVAQQERSFSGSGEPDPKIVAKLTEIVNIRERVAEEYEESLKSGRASADELADVELAEARINLAREKSERGALRNELQRLVQVHERRMQRFNELAKDRVIRAHVDRAQVALLEAQVRLLRVQK